MRVGHAALATTAILLCAAPPASAEALDARVIGAFAMQAQVTKAVNVRGERRGQQLQRRWTLTAQECEGSVCKALSLQRQRSRGIQEALTLKRTGTGVYAGRSSFYAPLRCKGRLYRRGARVPYRITLAVAGAEAVQGIAFARSITASYLNARRIDRTPCPLGPSHDAARYTGAALAPLPTPPSTSFTAGVDEADLTAAFAANFTAGVGEAPIVSRLWSFGDPASGAADSSTEAAPSHVFTAPGAYAVTLTVTDANGLTATASEQVQI